ncbi:MAG: hypothetical protein AAF415_00720 [Pseudomonadota bacterium]
MQTPKNARLFSVATILTFLLLGACTAEKVEPQASPSSSQNSGEVRGM